MTGRVTIISVLFLSLFSTIETKADEPIAIERVEIVSQRRALAKITFDTTLLKQFSNQTLGELLQGQSPVNVLDYGRGARQTASFRGTDPSHTTVTWNSLTINSPVEGSVDLSLLPLYSLDALSITPGISSLDQGSGALGGSIAIESRAQWQKRLDASATVGYGSFGSWDAAAAVRAGNDKFQSSTKVVYNSSQNNFWFINRDIIDPQNPNAVTWQQNRNAEYATAGVSQDFFVRLPRNQTLSVSVLTLGNDRNLPEITSYEGALNSNLTNSRSGSLRGVVKYKKHGEKLDIEVIAGATAERESFTKDVLTGDKYIKYIDSYSRGTTIQALGNLTWRIDKKQRHTMIGNTKMAEQLAASHEKVRGTGFDENRFEFSQKVELASRWSDAWSTSALLRLDVVGAKVSVSGLAGVQYAWQNGLSVAARGGYNSHHPSLSALYYTPGANPDLRPEKGPTAELALNYRKGWLEVSLTLFDSWIEDWIIWLPTATQYWTPSNLRSVNAMGAELTASASWRFEGDWGLSLRGSFALNRTINTGEPIRLGDMSQGVQLPFVPLVSGGAFAKIDYREKVWLSYWLNGESTKNSSTAGDQSALSTIEPFVINNLAVGYAPWRWLSVEITCRNLFDAYYYGIQRRPMAPFYVGGSATFRISN